MTPSRSRPKSLHFVELFEHFNAVLVFEIKLLAPLLADKFVSTSLDGKVTGKAEALAEVKTFVKNSAANSEMKVIVYGNTAIAIGIWKAKMKDPSGKLIDLNVRWTDTWVKMPDGKWQCVASHGSPAKM